jgi:hypothetical protein
MGKNLRRLFRGIRSLAKYEPATYDQAGQLISTSGLAGVAGTPLAGSPFLLSDVAAGAMPSFGSRGIG